MAGVPTMISCAAMRPPPIFFSSDCEITARSDSDSIERTIGFSPAGNTSMMRSMVLARRAGMQGAEHQVAGFRGGQRQADGFQVAHLADQDVVGVFTQRRAQGLVEAVGVAVHFALVDQALLRGVHEFDRILDGEDVAEFVLVDVVDHRRQRGRLARAGRAGDQDQALRLFDQLLEDLAGSPGLRASGSSAGNGAEHRAGAAVLVEGVDAEARQAGDLEARSRLRGIPRSRDAACPT